MRADETMEPGMVPSVLAISSGRGDPKRDSVVGVFLDSDGHFREHIKIDNLFEPDEEQANQFAELLKRRRPQVVVVGGYTPATTQLLTNIRNFAARVTEELLEEGIEDDSEYDEGFPPDAVAERKRNRASFESTYIYDDVARIYQNSSRATLEFPDLSTLGKYCVGLARYAQSPLNEYAALGPDINALSFDPNQKYVSYPSCRACLLATLILRRVRETAREGKGLVVARTRPDRRDEPRRRRHQPRREVSVLRTPVALCLGPGTSQGRADPEKDQRHCTRFPASAV